MAPPHRAGQFTAQRANRLPFQDILNQKRRPADARIEADAEYRRMITSLLLFMMLLDAGHSDVSHCPQMTSCLNTQKCAGEWPPRRLADDEGQRRE